MNRLVNIALAAVAGTVCLVGAALAADTAKPAQAKSSAAKSAKPAALPAPVGAIMAIPAEVRFHSTRGTAQIAIFFDETPAKAAHITKAAFVKKGWMFEVSKSKTDPGVVTVSTNPNTVEDGSYTLEIVAGGQTIHVEVYVTLGGPTPGATEIRLPPRLDFDATYKKGTTIEYKIDAPLDAEYVWTVNGHVVAQGPGEIKWVYTFDQIGPQIIRVRMKAPNGRMEESIGKTEVVP